MSKPEDIPQDVWDAAFKFCDEFEFGRVGIARAIVAERERCAVVADPIPLSADASNLEKQAHDIRLNIAAAIRKGGE